MVPINVSEPEMHVKDIFLDSMMLQARKGIDVQEATGISFNHIKLLIAETDPVMDVINSDNIFFNKMSLAMKKKNSMQRNISKNVTNSMSNIMNLSI